MDDTIDIGKNKPTSLVATDPWEKDQFAINHSEIEVFKGRGQKTHRSATNQPSLIISKGPSGTWSWMSKICQLVPRNRNESDTLSMNLLPLQHGNFGSQIIRGVDPPSLLSNSKD